MTTKIQTPFLHEKQPRNNFEVVKNSNGEIIAIIHHGFFQNSPDEQKQAEYTVIIECATDVGGSKQLETCKFETDTYQTCIDFLLEELGEVQS